MLGVVVLQLMLGVVVLQLIYSHGLQFFQPLQNYNSHHALAAIIMGGNKMSNESLDT